MPSPPTDTDEAASPTARLRILATTDLHMQILPFDYLVDRPAPGYGLAALADLIAAERAAPGVDVTLLFDNGDAVQGSPLSELIADGDIADPDGLHPMIRAMNMLGFDAAAAGNHDFAFGLDFLGRLSEQALFPILSANIRDGSGPVLPPNHLFERSVPGPGGAPLPLRIGVFGLAPPQTPEWERDAVGPGITGADLVQTAREQASALRRRGADLVIALAHSGTGPQRHCPGMENAARLISDLPGIDAVVAGHIHQRIPTSGTATSDAARIVMPGAHGSHLGIVDLTLTHAADGWQVRERRATLRSAGSEDTDAGQRVRRDTTPLHTAARAALSRQVGATAQPIHSYFGQVAPCPALSVLARAMVAHARGYDDATPIVAAVSPFRAGGQGGPQNYIDIPEGRLLRRHVPTLFPFPDSLCLIDLRGRDLLGWLEHSARAFARLKPGQADQSLLDRSVPAYQVDFLYGLTYTIDPTRMEGRIGDVRLRGGGPLDPDAPVRLVTTAFRAGGGGGYIRPGTEAIHDKTPIRQIVAEYLGSDAFDPSPECIWNFAPSPGTRAWFDTHPDADQWLDAPHLPRMRDMGLTDRGFRRLSLEL